MPHTPLHRLTMLSVWLISTMSLSNAAELSKTRETELLSGDRVVLGTVEEIRSDQARINIGEVESRFVPMNVRKDKALPDLKIGDLVEVTVNDQNLLVDVHKVGEVSQHRVVQGQLAGPLETGHDKAVIRTQDGKEESHLVRPVARSKVASIPIGAPVIFLIDELDKIVDVTFVSAEAVHRSAELSQKKSPLKGNLTKITGVILRPLDHNRISIRGNDGKERSYEVRPLIEERLKTLSKGDSVVLLVDDENKVTDVAFLQGKQK